MASREGDREAKRKWEMPRSTDRKAVSSFRLFNVSVGNSHHVSVASYRRLYCAARESNVGEKELPRGLVISRRKRESKKIRSGTHGEAAYRPMVHVGRKISTSATLCGIYRHGESNGLLLGQAADFLVCLARQISSYRYLPDRYPYILSSCKLAFIYTIARRKNNETILG